MNTKTASSFSVKLASSQAELEAAQRLRYEVFIAELGGCGDMVDHKNQLEKDRFDPYFDHLVLTDTSCDMVVGVYRLMRQDQAERAGGFYSASEYDLSPLISSGRKILELGRSCLHKDYRGGMAMFHLWNGLASYVRQHDIDVLFGVASFHGTDTAALAEPLSLLHHRHLAPKELRVRAQPSAYQPMNLMPESQLNRPVAMKQIPSLIKAYLKLGGFVGDGAFVDRAFNTTDVCLILDTAQMNERQARFYQGSTA